MLLRSNGPMAILRAKMIGKKNRIVEIRVYIKLVFIRVFAKRDLSRRKIYYHRS